MAQSSFANRRRRPPHGQPSPPCSSLLKPFQKLASKKQRTAHRGRKRCSRNVSREHRRTCEHAAFPLPARANRRLRRASFFYRSSPKYRGSAPRNLPLCCKLFFLLSNIQKKPTLSCTSGFAARCHLRPSLPRGPQITTHTPSQGSITVNQ